MKKPKIGDIVIFCDSDDIVNPAIVRRVFANNELELCVFSFPSTRVHAKYSEELKEGGYWSWPEEEKQCKPKECEHKWIVESHFLAGKRRRCDICDLREDIPPKEKQCEHDYDLDRSGEKLTFDLKCKKCGVISKCPIKNMRNDKEEKQEICKVCNQLPVLLGYENKFCSIDCAITDQFEKEKSKECEHDYFVKREEFGRTAHYFLLTCKKCGKENEMLPCDEKNKAEELIEKISALVQYHSSGYALEISNLIEEYKGIK